MSDLRTDPTPWVFDADGHVIEPPRVWDELLPAEFRGVRATRPAGGRPLPLRVRPACRLPDRGAQRGDGGTGPDPTNSDDAGRRTRAAPSPAPGSPTWPSTASTAAALYPTFGLMIQGVTEREPAVALCRALNDWVAEYCSSIPSTLIGVATLPMTSADDALAEARRCVEQHGFRGVWRRPEHFDSLPRLQDAEYEPLWSYPRGGGRAVRHPSRA